MEHKIIVPSARPVRPSLLLLNDYCLMDIFEFIDIDDSINLAKSCNRLKFVALRTFKKHSDFLLDSGMVAKGIKYIDHLFCNIGQHVTTLRFACDNSNENLSEILGKISNNCVNLKNLICTVNRRVYWKGNVQPSAYSFDKVEVLLSYNCYHDFAFDVTKHFFESFHRLRTVMFSNTFIESYELRTVLRNNRSIESFVYCFNRYDFNCQLLELIPNVTTLCLIGKKSYGAHIVELNSLLKLNQLTKLQLDCDNKNLDNFLRKLATRGIIEEMQLRRVNVDGDFFDILTSFSKLQLLVIVSSSSLRVKLKTSMVWPAQLKKLRLSRFELTHNDLIEMIGQLEGIESIDIGVCTIAKDDIINFNDVKKWSRDIRLNNRKQRLDVVLPHFVAADPSEKFCCESEHLRIWYWSRKPNRLGINICFPYVRIVNKRGTI